MIFSKSNLQVVKMTKVDNKIPVLDNVHFMSNGGTVGTNGVAVIAVSPVEKRFLDHVIFEKEKIKPLNISYTISAESIREVLKVLPKDTKFSGVLELVNFSGDAIELHDGKRKKSIEVKQYAREYTEYKDVFKTAYKTIKDHGAVSTAINLDRLYSIIDCLKEICNDTAQNTILFIQFTNRGDIVFRTRNKQGQQVVSMIKAYSGVEGSIPEFTNWEKDLFSVNEIDHAYGGQYVGYSKEIYKAYGENAQEKKVDKKVGKIEKIKRIKA